jgi:pimeloyl-ACP methyl ester carboxylesterase
MARLAYSTVGDPAQPAVLLVHGFLSSNAQWLLNRDTLAKRYHLVLAELWGHGRSPTPEDLQAYSVAAYSAQFEQIRAQLGIERWALIGQSYGAGLAIRYALAHPHRCTALVVTNSRSAFGDISGSASQDEQPRGQPSSPRDLPIHPINARRFPQHVKDALVADADAIPMEAIRAGGRLARDLNSADVLGDLSMPVLLTNGMFEKAFQPEVAGLRERYPRLEVADLEGGHSVNIEAADAFDRVVLDFLDRSTTPPTAS